jgi:hypothetical protein
MNSYSYERQPAPQGWRRYSWIIILAVGVGLGALLVGPIGGQLWFMDGRGDRGGMTARSERQSQASAPDTAQPQTDPRRADPRGDAAEQLRGDSRGGRHGGLFPFDQLELLASLLLIGGGAWLIWGRRRGPWQRGDAGPTYPAAPREPMPPPHDQAETGETRRL